MKKRLGTILILLVMLLIAHKSYPIKAPTNCKVLKRQLKRTYRLCGIGRGDFDRWLRNTEIALSEAFVSGLSVENITQAIIEGLPYQEVGRWLIEEDRLKVQEDVVLFLARCKSKKLRLKTIKRFVFLWLKNNVPSKQSCWEGATAEVEAETLCMSNRFEVLSLEHSEV